MCCHWPSPSIHKKKKIFSHFSFFLAFTFLSFVSHFHLHFLSAVSCFTSISCPVLAPHLSLPYQPYLTYPVTFTHTFLPSHVTFRMSSHSRSQRPSIPALLNETVNFFASTVLASLLVYKGFIEKVHFGCLVTRFASCRIHECFFSTVSQMHNIELCIV